MAAYFALDNILHNGRRYEPGDELGGEDFTEPQLERLCVAGVAQVSKELSVAAAESLAKAAGPKKT